MLTVIAMRHAELFAIVLVLVLAGGPLRALGGSEAPWVGEDHNGKPCNGGTAGNYGPYDYRVDKGKLPVVENRHFTERVELLKQGETVQHAMGDVNYTLVHFPNHHRALHTAVTFSLREGDTARGRKHPAECYLQRAIQFRPDDPVPYMLYGLYLHRLGRVEAAMTYYRRAEDFVPTDPNLLYNMGLAFFDRGEYQRARQYATRAYSQGMSLPGLKRKLASAGYPLE